ncbi:hypothetical protein Patl1_11717 [Pistacia atlantica]|uniref:Uncharacterized protein n=1 Tax=Pistacia atlantica TaxID=434234 RepID=A0ACC1A448_9ROSI|nr:hypothetical protein Patl1_11717 [Pistacia atlantica]
MGGLRRVGRRVVAGTVCYDWKIGGMGGSTTAEGGGNGWECGCWSFRIYIVSFNIELKALNSIFQKWGVLAPPGLWNISGEPCTGTAVNGTKWEDHAVSIVCNCSYNNNSTCHITHLRVFAQDSTGVIPVELTSLQYLTHIVIDQNYMYGTLPAFIGNLTRLTYLSMGHNEFSGSLPKELGNLKELNFLAIGSNNFSGTLPPELGNLAKLDQPWQNGRGVVQHSVMLGITKGRADLMKKGGRRE